MSYSEPEGFVSLASPCKNNNEPVTKKYHACTFVSQDFLRPEALKVGGVFFDALFNLNKFIGFEQRDPFAERQRRNDPFETDWDRWVHDCMLVIYHTVALKHIYV